MEGQLSAFSTLLRCGMQRYAFADDQCSSFGSAATQEMSCHHYARLEGTLRCAICPLHRSRHACACVRTICIFCNSSALLTGSDLCSASRTHPISGQPALFRECLWLQWVPQFRDVGPASVVLPAKFCLATSMALSFGDVLWYLFELLPALAAFVSICAAVVQIPPAPNQT